MMGEEGKEKGFDGKTRKKAPSVMDSRGAEKKVSALRMKAMGSQQTCTAFLSFTRASEICANINPAY